MYGVLLFHRMVPSGDIDTKMTVSIILILMVKLTVGTILPGTLLSHQTTQNGDFNT